MPHIAAGTGYVVLDDKLYLAGMRMKSTIMHKINNYT